MSHKPILKSLTAVGDRALAERPSFAGLFNKFAKDYKKLEVNHPWVEGAVQWAVTLTVAGGTLIVADFLTSGTPAGDLSSMLIVGGVAAVGMGAILSHSSHKSYPATVASVRRLSAERGSDEKGVELMLSGSRFQSNGREGVFLARYHGNHQFHVGDHVSCHRKEGVMLVMLVDPVEEPESGPNQEPDSHSSTL